MSGTLRPRGWRRRTGCAAAIGTMVMLGLAGCGGSSSSGSIQAGTTPQKSSLSGAPEAKTLKVAVQPATVFAPVYLGVKEGLFKKYGLNVEPELNASGQAGIASLVSGDLDVTTSNYFGATFADEQGIHLSVIAPAFQSVAHSSAVMVMPNSSIKSAADLVGKTVGVTSLKNVDIMINSDLQQEGIDWRKIKYVELAPADAGAALQKGQVDATFAAEPLLNDLEKTLHARSVLDIEGSKPMLGAELSGYVTSASFAKKNPNTIAAFQCGLADSVALAQKDPALVRSVFGKFIPVPASVIASLPMPKYVKRLDVGKLAESEKMLVDQGLISKPYDLAGSAISTPTSCKAVS